VSTRSGGCGDPAAPSLEREGCRLADPDLRIAATALTQRATLVTGNARHFARLPGLEVEDWIRGHAG